MCCLETVGCIPILLFRILFQREVYPSDDFVMVKKYGQTLLVTEDPALENYLKKSVAITRLRSAQTHSTCWQDSGSS